MDRRWLIFIAIMLVAAWWWTTKNRDDVVRYRGQAIKLSKTYADFDEYKNDPNNIDPSETARVQKLVMEAPIARSFTNRLDLFRDTQEIAFPGYGSGVVGVAPQKDGTELFAVLIEIPRAQKDRYFIFRGHDQRFELIDDFVCDELPYPTNIGYVNGSYIFYGRDGKERFRHPAVLGRY